MFVVEVKILPDVKILTTIYLIYSVRCLDNLEMNRKCKEFTRAVSIKK